MNENYAQPSLPGEIKEGVLKGCYLFNTYRAKNQTGCVTLLGSGAILTEVIKAAEQLADKGVTVFVYSITSWSELARDGMACEKAMLNDEAHIGTPYLYQQLESSQGPIIAATDYVRALPESVRAYIPAERRYLTLGTDGFGRSDTRAALRSYFGVDAESITRAALRALR